MWFLLTEVSSPVLAAEMSIAPNASSLIATADLQLGAVDATFENYRMELGNVAPSHAFSFEEDAPSPLFMATTISATNPNRESNVSDWNYLWRNASRIPIASIPEPTTGSLIIGGAILLCRRRMQKPSEPLK